MYKPFQKISILFLLVLISLPCIAQDYLVDFTFLGKKTKAELFLIFFQNVEYDINLYKIRYKTPGVDMVNDTASGLLVIPIVTGETQLPIVVYDHGTTSGPTDVPSRLAGGYEVAMAYAGSGFITVAPDYLGLGDSRGFHPYVHAATEASASLDMLNASLEYLDANPPDWNPYYLFIAGYSQGGHASMALHQEIDQNWSFVYPVTAATHMSGPYSMSGAMRDRILSDAPYGSPAYVAYILLAYNQFYDLYTDINQVFKTPYAATIDSFYHGTINLDVLNNKLLAQLSAGGNATIAKRMLQDTLIDAIVANPNHKFNLALADNDTYNFAPTAPTRLYYCGADEQVTPQNTLIAAPAMQALGATDVQALNLNPNFSHGTCVFPAIVSSVAFFKSFLNASGTKDVNPIKDELKFFPNPASDFISVDWTEAQHGFQYNIINTSGMEVGRGSTTSSHLSLGQLPQGLYMIRCTVDGTSKTGRILHQ